MNTRIVAATLGLCLAGSIHAPQAKAGQSTIESVKGPSLDVKLIDAEAKARNNSATVSVKVHGLKIVDSASVNEKPAKGQGHLHYRLDNGPIIATTATKLSFHALAAGAHSFTVSLAGNDHAPLGPSQTVEVTVP